MFALGYFAVVRARASGAKGEHRVKRRAATAYHARVSTSLVDCGRCSSAREGLSDLGVVILGGDVIKPGLDPAATGPD